MIKRFSKALKVSEKKEEIAKSYTSKESKKCQSFCIVLKKPVIYHELL